VCLCVKQFSSLAKRNSYIKKCVCCAEQGPGNKETTGPTIEIRSDEGREEHYFFLKITWQHK